MSTFDGASIELRYEPLSNRWLAFIWLNDTYRSAYGSTPQEAVKNLLAIV